jgi:hypothetical protein
MEKCMLKKRIVGVCFLFTVLLMLYPDVTTVYATNITLPGGSGNDVPGETVPVETAPAETVTAAQPATDSQPEVIVMPEQPVDPVVPEQPADPITEAPQPEDAWTSTEEETPTDTETEDVTETEQVDSQEEISGETEMVIESSPEETWPMGFSGAGDGQATQEDTTVQSEEQTKQKEGAGTIAKIFAGIVMVLMIGGVVAYGYFSAAAKEELHRRERRARAWSDYGDEDNE